MNYRISTISLFAAATGALPVPAQPIVQDFVRMEPGMEEAVQWKWEQRPSDGIPWQLPVRAHPVRKIGATTPLPLSLSEENVYTVRRGDALIKIAKKFGITVEQLKYANGLTSDLIRVGDTLRIPPPEEIAQMPAPNPPTASQSETQPRTGPQLPPGVDREILLFQVFLDRQEFSVGPIDGKMSLGFRKLIYLYQQEYPHLRDLDALRAAASGQVQNLLTSYSLKEEDFQFIETSSPAKGARGTPPSYQSMMSAPFLAYRSAWGFVAERFHCDESLLQALNPAIKSNPVAGTNFFVPNVIPFEIESALEEPIQPSPDPGTPITATIVDLVRLTIHRGDKLVAVFPVSRARPGLRGRGTWTILNALPKPRLATVHEPRVTPKTYTMPGEEDHMASGPKLLETPNFLPPGPRNPIGVLWINLAKEGEDEPLPYGLHGTSTPDQMFFNESIGGFRLTNWDIVRAARMLPKGTPLRWGQGPQAPVRVPR